MNQLLVSLITFIFLSNYPTLNLSANENDLEVCPQERKTNKAPRVFYRAKNPLENSIQYIKDGKLIYERTARPLQCAICHGIEGNGIGDPDFESTPSARNFTCIETMSAISDGQLFWIIKKGSAGTSMPKFDNLDDKNIWKLVLYIRSLSKKKEGT